MWLVARVVACFAMTVGVNGCLSAPDDGEQSAPAQESSASVPEAAVTALATWSCQNASPAWNTVNTHTDSVACASAQSAAQAVCDGSQYGCCSIGPCHVVIASDGFHDAWRYPVLKTCGGSGCPR
jgi:hypothetical protein